MWSLLTSDTLVDFGHKFLADAQLVLEALSHAAVPVRVETALGPAVQTLATASHGARLVVLGHRSASMVEGLFTGSTIIGVVARSACPVISVPMIGTKAIRTVGSSQRLTDPRSRRRSWPTPSPQGLCASVGPVIRLSLGRSVPQFCRNPHVAGATVGVRRVHRRGRAHDGTVVGTAITPLVSQLAR
ncbi:universal stress protein [Oerskovia sp. NPDC060338]|uniref:universal stress protein n=1 Tax=Oerskovia sp. NPDC060338 TaxID=3347100 RepID=UPI0036558E7C